MAYSSVRVQFEIGHEASLRNKRTPEGFTHDWEVFLRGGDNAEIQFFVEKVVFHLHETFQKPKRVFKEPPYVLKESGYAGFVLEIDVYLRNKEEPKKIKFNYDLQLQSSGPPIAQIMKEPRVFQNPSEDFRRKLIRGGGVGVNIPTDNQLPEPATSNKSKPEVSVPPVKKHKPDLPLSNSFADLFGTPIRRVTPELKKVNEVPKKVNDSLDVKEKKVAKYSPHKDAIKEKEKLVEKDKSKVRSRSKERVKKPPSPPPQIIKAKDEHKRHEERDKKREHHDEKKKKKEERDKKEKHREEKQPEKEIKKEKVVKEIDIKEKEVVRKPEIVKSHDRLPLFEKHSVEKSEKEKPEKEKHRHKHKKKEKERDKERHKKDREERDSKEKSKKKHVEGAVKEKNRKRSPSPLPEIAKKRPLNKLFDGLSSSNSPSSSSEDEDSMSSLTSKSTLKSVPEKTTPVINVKTKSTNHTEIVKNDRDLKTPKLEEPKHKKEKSSAKKSKKTEDKKKRKERERSLSSDIEIEKLRKEKEKALEKEREEKERLERERIEKELLLEKERLEKERLEKERIEREKERERLEKERERERLEKERLEKERERERLEKEKERERLEKLEKERIEKERLEKEKLEKEKLEKERLQKEKLEKEKANRKQKRERLKNEALMKKEVSPVQNNVASQSEVTEDKREKFTKEYVSQLRELQHKIMTLEDNRELQKVVQVIADTGLYEITKKTFDFDLCALDTTTVKKLQEFFATTT